MIFVINNLKYDTDKMEIVSRKCRISYPSDLYGSFIKKYAIETILWKSNKGNWLVTYKKSSNDTVYAEALTSTQAMSLLVQYDFETYEKIFGEIEGDVKRMDIVEFCEKMLDHPLFNFQKILLRKLYDATKNSNQLERRQQNGKNERSGNYAG